MAQDFRMAQAELEFKARLEYVTVSEQRDLDFGEVATVLNEVEAHWAVSLPSRTVGTIVHGLPRFPVTAC